MKSNEMSDSVKLTNRSVCWLLLASRGWNDTARYGHEVTIDMPGMWRINAIDLLYLSIALLCTHILSLRQTLPFEC